MPLDLSKWGPLTVLIVALALVATAGGLIVVIVAPDTLNFHDYLDELKAFMLALVGLAGAHGLLGAGQKVADAHRDAAVVQAAGELTGLSEGAGKAEGGEGFAENPQ